MQTLDEIIEAFKATRHFILLIPLEDEIQVCPVSDKGEVFVLDSNMSMMDCLGMLRSHNDPEIKSSLLNLARKLNVLGLKYKNHGGLSDAYLCYRIALIFAYHFKEEEGIENIARNIRILLEQLMDLTVRGNEISLNVTDEKFNVIAREQYIAALNRDPVAQNTVKAKLKQTKKLIRADAVGLLHQMGLEDKEEAAKMAFSDHMLSAAWELSVAANYTTLRKGLTKKRLAAYEKNKDDKGAYWLILEELAVIDLIEFMMELSHPRQQEPYFSYIWNKYEVQTQNIKDLLRTYPVVSLYESVFRQFEYISFSLTSGGGAFGHLANYNFSGFFQMIGRDYISFCVLQQPEEMVKAYELAEQIRNRSMINWMGRSVSHSRLPKQAIFPLLTDFRGSVNAVEPIHAEQLARIPASTGAQLISYLLTPLGMLAWLQTTTGGLHFSIIDWEKTSRLLKSYLQTDGEGITLKPPDTQFFNSIMADLYIELFPAKFREELDLLDTKKIILLTDHELDYLPFCALLTPSNEYLIEKYEISYLSSLTAFYIHDRDATAGTGRNGWRPPLIMGLTDFTEQRKKTGLPLNNLDGVKEELATIAALLNTPYFLNSEVNYKKLYEQGFHCRILHMASHAWINMEKPDESFFVLYDTLVKASQIYQLDRGFRNGMVVLSACQTGLGNVALDAGFSMSNAFIVAGAKSVISSLWQVPDEATMQLMDQFYTGLCEGQTIPAALRQAQLGLIGNKEYMHPLNWAGFKSLGLLMNPAKYGE